MQGLRKRKSSSSSSLTTAVAAAIVDEWKRNKRLFCFITIAISLWSVEKVNLGNVLNVQKEIISLSSTTSYLVGSSSSSSNSNDTVVFGSTSTTSIKQQVTSTTTTSSTTTSIVSWPPPHMLQKIAVNNTIIVISTNCGYLEMAQNWILHVQQLNITNYLVIAQDETVYNVLKKYITTTIPQHEHDHGHDNDHVVLLNRSVHNKKTNNTTTSDESTTTSSSNEAYGFRSEGFYDICKQRPYMIESILKQGYNTLYSDIDLVWIRNVFEKIQSILVNSVDSSSGSNNNNNVRRLDYIGMTEIPGIGDEFNPNVTINEYEKMNNMCSALIYFQSNNTNVTNLINEWNQRMIQDTKLTGEDQTHFQRALRTLYGNYTSYWLDTLEFPPGFMYFNDIRKGRKGYSKQKLSLQQKQNNVYAVHANWMKGYQTKIDHLRNAGHWLVTDENRLSC